MLDFQNAEFFGPKPIKNLTMCVSVFKARESTADPDLLWVTTNGHERKMRTRSCPEASRNLFDRTTVYWVFRFFSRQSGLCSTALLNWKTPSMLQTLSRTFCPCWGSGQLLLWWHSWRVPQKTGQLRGNALRRLKDKRGIYLGSTAWGMKTKHVSLLC